MESNEKQSPFLFLKGMQIMTVFFSSLLFRCLGYGKNASYVLESKSPLLFQR